MSGNRELFRGVNNKKIAIFVILPEEQVNIDKEYEKKK